MDWRIATGIICCFGVFKDFRPSESYITAYLMAPEWKNLTIEQVNNEIYPVWTYSYLVTLVLVLLFTDFLRYKMVIIFEALSYITTWILLLWGQGIVLMQLMQFTFGCATSTEIAYYSYIYAAINETHYRQVSSFVRASSLAGRFVAALLAQLLLTFADATYFVLNVISFVNVCICFFIALLLPSIRNSFYFDKDTDKNCPKTSAFQCPKQGDEGKVMISKNETELAEMVKKGSNIEDYSKESDEGKLMIAKDGTENCNSSTANYQEPVSVLKNEEEEDVCSVEQENKLISDHNKDHAVNTDSLLKRTEIRDMSDKSHMTLIKDSFHFFTKNRLRQIVPNSVSIQEGLCRMWLDFLSAYKDRKLLMWSVWWASTTCGKIHLGNYIQSLYEVIRVDHNSAYNYNAAVDATSLAICAAASFGIGFVTVDWSKYGELLLFFVNMVIGGLMVWMSFTDSIWVAYVAYLIIRIIFQTVLTIATYQVAVHLSSRCYGLVFGLNTFLALILETIMTVIVVDKHGLNLDVRTQFVVYGGYFGCLALPFLMKFIYSRCFCKKNQMEVSEVC